MKIKTYAKFEICQIRAFNGPGYSIFVKVRHTTHFARSGHTYKKVKSTLHCDFLLDNHGKIFSVYPIII